jgi:hypothetical protein
MSTDPNTRIMQKLKHWWTKELMQLQACANKLGRISYKLRNLPEHKVHCEHKEAKGKYQRTLKNTKQQHWRDWLEKAKDPDTWTAHKVISAPPTDGGKAKIPKLKHRIGEEDVTASTNEEKSAALARNFFPVKPQDESQADDRPMKTSKGAGKITREQIRAHLKTIKLYKAPGPDSIPNIVLSRCADLIVNRLFHIFEAMLERKLLYKP